MRIEWLNGDLTKAVATKGWFRRRTATIRRITELEWRQQQSYCWWRFVPSDRPFDDWQKVEAERKRELLRRERDDDWREPAEIPRAELRSPR